MRWQIFFRLLLLPKSLKTLTSSLCRMSIIKKTRAILYSEENTHWCSDRREVSKQAVSSENQAGFVLFLLTLQQKLPLFFLPQRKVPKGRLFFSTLIHLSITQKISSGQNFVEISQKPSHIQQLKFSLSDTYQDNYLVIIW